MFSKKCCQEGVRAQAHCRLLDRKVDATVGVKIAEGKAASLEKLAQEIFLKVLYTRTAPHELLTCFHHTFGLYPPKPTPPRAQREYSGGAASSVGLFLNWGPEDHISIRMLHSGPKEQDKGDSRILIYHTYTLSLYIYTHNTYHILWDL